MTKTAAAEAVTTHWTAYTALICDSLKQLTLEQQNIMNALGVSTTKNTGWAVPTVATVPNQNRQPRTSGSRVLFVSNLVVVSFSTINSSYAPTSSCRQFCGSFLCFGRTPVL
jgi:hypothetical protein